MLSTYDNRNTKRRRLNNDRCKNKYDPTSSVSCKLGKTIEDQAYLEEMMMREQEARKEEMNERSNEFNQFCDVTQRTMEIFLTEPLSDSLAMKVAERSNNTIKSMREEQKLLNHWYVYLHQAFFINRDITKDFLAAMIGDDQTQAQIQGLDVLINTSKRLMEGMLKHEATITCRHKEFLGKIKTIEANSGALSNPISTKRSIDRAKRNSLHRLAASNEDLIFEMKSHHAYLIRKCKMLRSGTEVLDRMMKTYMSYFSEEAIETIEREVLNNF